MKRFSDESKGFINSTQWIFAKTYAATWPHHYIVRDRVDENFFVKMVEHIRRFGYEGQFYKMKITYFDEDGYVYWTMGDPIEEETIINRCKKEDTYEDVSISMDDLKNPKSMKAAIRPFFFLSPLDNESSIYGNPAEYRLYVIDSSGGKVRIIERDESQKRELYFDGLFTNEDGLIFVNRRGIIKERESLFLSISLTIRGITSIKHLRKELVLKP